MATLQPLTTETTPTPDQRLSRVAAVLLGIVGIQAWLILGQGDYGHRHELWWIAAAILASLIPPVRHSVDRFWNFANSLTFPRRLLVALFIALISIPLILWTERCQQIDIRIYVHDEFSYWLQMHMLADGRLWMPALPLPRFFDSFYIFVQPAYASIYFPGTSLLFVPAVWMHLPFYAGPLAAGGMCLGLFYLVTAEILDGSCAFLAVILLAAVGLFRVMSVMLLSEIPMLMLGLLMILACLRGRCAVGSSKIIWALLLGIASGWAAITRPIDAVCFAIPVAICIMADLLKCPAKIRFQTVILVLIGAAPFLILQLIFNHGLTGHWLKIPHELYTEQNFPGPNFGFAAPPTVPPLVSDVPEKQLFFEHRITGERLAHHLAPVTRTVRDRFDNSVSPVITDSFYWILIPLSLFPMWKHRRWILWGTLPGFLVAYTCYAWFVPYYPTTVIPAILLFVLMPIPWLAEIFPAHRAGIRTGIGLALAILAIASFPQFDRLTTDLSARESEMKPIDELISQNVLPPAIVLIHFNLNTPAEFGTITDDPEIEPVFNSDVAWPDDAPIIHARDLNSSLADVATPRDQNRPLYEYYSRIDPRRVVYLLDRHGARPILEKLGTPAEILRQISLAQ